MGFGIALMSGEGLEVGGVAFVAPAGKERGVEALATEESADSAGSFDLIGFGKNRDL